MNTKKKFEKKSILPVTKEAKNEAFLDNEFADAFTKFSKVFEQLVKKIEKNPDVGKSQRFAIFSQAFQGFSQNNVSKKEGFTLEVKIDIKVSGPKKN